MQTSKLIECKGDILVWVFLGWEFVIHLSVGLSQRNTFGKPLHKPAEFLIFPAEFLIRAAT